MNKRAKIHFKSVQTNGTNIHCSKYGQKIYLKPECEIFSGQIMIISLLFCEFLIFIHTMNKFLVLYIKPLFLCKYNSFLYFDIDFSIFPMIYII